MAAARTGSLGGVIGRRAPAPAAPAVLLVVLGLIVIGCGEKSEPPTTGKVITQSTTAQDGAADLAAAQAAADAFLASPNAAAVCDKGITPKLLKRAYGDRKGCLKARKPAALAKDVRITAAKLGPDGTATVVASAAGGVYGKGEKLTMTVVRDGGRWRVDVVKSNAKVGP